MRCVQHLEKDSDVMIRLSHQQVSNSEGSGGFGWEIVVLHEMGKGLVEVMIAGKRPFGVFGVEELAGVAV